MGVRQEGAIRWGHVCHGGGVGQECASERGGWAWAVVKVVAGEKGLGGGAPRRGFSLGRCLDWWLGRDVWKRMKLTYKLKKL